MLSFILFLVIIYYQKSVNAGFMIPWGYSYIFPFIIFFGAQIIRGFRLYTLLKQNEIGFRQSILMILMGDGASSILKIVPREIFYLWFNKSTLNLKTKVLLPPLLIMRLQDLFVLILISLCFKSYIPVGLEHLLKVWMFLVLFLTITGVLLIFLDSKKFVDLAWKRTNGKAILISTLQSFWGWLLEALAVMVFVSLVSPRNGMHINNFIEQLYLYYSPIPSLYYKWLNFLLFGVVSLIFFSYFGEKIRKKPLKDLIW